MLAYLRLVPCVLELHQCCSGTIGGLGCDFVRFVVCEVKSRNVSIFEKMLEPIPLWYRSLVGGVWYGRGCCAMFGC